MSCGSTPSRVYTSSVKAVCASSGGSCLPCPATGTHYQESVFRNATPSCGITTSPLNVNQMFLTLLNVFDGSVNAPTRANADGYEIPLNAFDSHRILNVVMNQSPGITVLCTLTGECETSILRVSPLSTHQFTDLVGVNTTQFEICLKPDCVINAGIARSDAVGSSGFFSA